MARLKSTCRWCGLKVRWYHGPKLWGRDSGDPMVQFRCQARSKHPDSQLRHEPEE